MLHISDAFDKIYCMNHYLFHSNWNFYRALLLEGHARLRLPVAFINSSQFSNDSVLQWPMKGLYPGDFSISEHVVIFLSSSAESKVVDEVPMGLPDGNEKKLKRRDITLK